jgi:acetyl-CoA carboxylase carboxyltransferase component
MNLKQLSEEILAQETKLREGGGASGKERQKALGRLTVRERIDLLCDKGSPFFEIGLWAAYKMYPEWGDLPAAGVVTGIGRVSDRDCMIIANDATVKAGAMFPQSVKKVLRAQKIAFENQLPLIYLVDSSGVFLPLQDEIFPDEDDFGRIFRNNSVISASGLPQYAAIMGNCIAGGGYLPVLCDKLLMTEGSGLYLAGPALVKAAIGHEYTTEELGGAKMHSQISGTVDFREKDDPSCLKRLRSLMESLPEDTSYGKINEQKKKAQELYNIVGADSRKEYDVHDLLECILDEESFEEYKAEYGKTLVVGYAQIGGIPIGVVANQRKQCQTGKGETEVGGVLYTESADKGARFVLECNQTQVPILFLQDVMGFMVGKAAEESGIIRSGAKLVNAVSNSIVPKITVIVGNSFGAGNYALCGKAYDPRFMLAWPNAKYAVMGADQAAETLFQVQKKTAERQGKLWNAQEAKEMHEKIQQRYNEQTDIRYGAARGWVDAIIPPHETRNQLIRLFHIAKRKPYAPVQFRNGVIQT